MKALPFLALFILPGCSTTASKTNTTEGGFILAGKSALSGSEFKLVNNSPDTLMYEHWFGQKGHPVAYCDDGKPELYVCSKNVFLLGDEFYTHETMLKPKEKVWFIANSTGAIRIGVKFYNYNKKPAEYLIWHKISNDK